MIEYRKYKIETLTKLLGTASGNPELYREYIQSKAPDPKDADDELETCPHNHVMDPNEEWSKAITGFHRHPKGRGLVIYDYQIMGFIKNAANVLKDNLNSKGIKNCRSKVNQFVTVFPRRTLIADEPDGVEQRPLRAQTQQGPRVTLAASEFLEPPVEFEIILGLINNKEISWGVINTLWRYGEVRAGLLQNRNSGYGKFRATDLGVIDPETENLPTI